MKKVFFYLILCFCDYAVSQTINIGLFNEHNLQTLVFSPVRGTYQLISDGRKNRILAPGQEIYLTVFNDSLRLITFNQEIGTFHSIHFIPQTDSCYFTIKPVAPSLNRRTYEDGMSMKVQWKRIQIINHVEMDKYIAGVVQSEGGSRAPLEYYKTQAVLCRTYVLRNFTKHGDEGFNLCDGVHCQAYLNRADKNIQIIEAAFFTRNQVTVDKNNNLILAVFHSNCGGITENSEDVWPQSESYLRSVTDPYCQNQRNSRWEKSIALDKWKSYLRNNGFKSDLDYDPSYFNFTQYERKKVYKIKEDSILLRKIRMDWGLKSTFFSIHAEGGKLIFSGRGYGHGVGMCQEGSMQMAKLGYMYNDILTFYYKETTLTDFHKLKGIGILFNEK